MAKMTEGLKSKALYVNNNKIPEDKK